jgi:hypothetical protein
LPALEPNCSGTELERLIEGAGILGRAKPGLVPRHAVKALLLLEALSGDRKPLIVDLPVKGSISLLNADVPR